MGIKPQIFYWYSRHGDEGVISIQDNFLQRIESHIPLIENYGRQIRLSEKSRRSRHTVSSSGESLHYAWLNSNKAIEYELLQHEVEAAITIRRATTTALKRTSKFSTDFNIQYKMSLQSARQNFLSCQESNGK